MRYKTQDTRDKVQDSRYKRQDTKHKIHVTRYNKQDKSYKIKIKIIVAFFSFMQLGTIRNKCHPNKLER